MAVLHSLHLLKGQMLVLGGGGWEEARPSLGQAAWPPSGEGLMQRGSGVLSRAEGSWLSKP